MTSLQRKKLTNIITMNSKLFQIKLKDKQDGYLIKQDFNLITFLENELFSWELQITIDLAIEGRIHMMMFLHPVVITQTTRSAYIEFANEANMYLGSAMGRFWVNDDNDYCYECYLPDFLLEYEQELEQQLFDKPFAHFRDLLTPLIKMKDGEWDSQYAIQFLTKLRKQGYVDNREYNLW